jgi:hypothetical protein
VQPVGDLGRKRKRLGVIRRVVAAGVALERSDQTRDLLAPDLEHPPDPLPWRLGRAGIRVAERTGPRRRMDVHVLLPHGGRKNEVPPAREEAGACRAADPLPAAERNEIGSLADELRQARA